MDFKIRTLRYFVAVAEAQSITRAAEKLYVAQPSLSQRIRALEEWIGFALFDRSHGQLLLTPEGKSFLPIARKLVEAANVAGASVRNLRKGNHGTLRLGGSWYSLNRPETQVLVDDFTDQNPGIEVIVIRESYSPTLLSRLRHRELDVTFVSGPVIGRDLEAIALKPFVPHLLLPSELEIARDEIIPQANLKGLQIAWYRREDNPQLFDATVTVLDKLGIVIVSPPDTHLDAIARYTQRHRLATFAQSDIASGFPDMVSRPIEGAPVSFEWSLVRLKEAENPCALRYWSFVQRFIEGGSGEGEMD